MANRFYGLNKGDNMQVAITEGSSTGSKDVEINVDLSKSMSKNDVLLLLEELEGYITKGPWPPA